MNSPELTAPEAGAKAPYSIRVLGVGGAGCNAVAQLAAEALPGVAYAVMSMDAAGLALSPVATRLNLGAKLSRGLSAGGDPERGKAAAEEDAVAIRALCAGASLVFVVAGLGGGTGTGAAPVVARIAKEAGALVLGLVITPFDCEGSRRQRQAAAGLQELKVAADGVICLPNQRVSKLIGEHTSLVEAFQITNGLVTQAVRGIWGLLSRPGLIRVDFADLCAVTQDRHAESCLASAEAQGENRSRDVTERLLAHPLLEEGALLSEASSVLVAIAGSRSLTLGEVNWIMERIRRQCEQAQLTLGAAIDEELGDRLVVTVVAARRSAGELPPGVRPDEAAAVGLTAEPEAPATGVRSAGRFVPPPPVLTAEKTEELFAQQNAAGARGRKGSSRLKQATLPLEILSRGRFEKSEPTLHGGQDLDVPTYLRRGVALN